MTNVVFLPSLVYFVFFLQPGQWPESWWGKRVKSLIAIVLELCSLAFFLDFLTTALELIPGGLFANLSCRIVHSTFFFVTSFQVHSFFFFCEKLSQNDDSWLICIYFFPSWILTCLRQICQFYDCEIYLPILNPQNRKLVRKVNHCFGIRFSLNLTFLVHLPLQRGLQLAVLSSFPSVMICPPQSNVFEAFITNATVF